MTFQLYNDDCLTKMGDIPDHSVDMILCDLPYGTTQCKWDAIIPFDALWAHYTRIIKSNGAIVLTACQPFTSALVMSNIKWFKYDWTWEKTKITGVLNAKKQPVRCKEDILVFYKNQPTYNPQGLIKIDRMSGTGATKANENGNATGRITQTESGKYLQEYGNYPRNVLKIASEGGTVHPTQKPVALMEYLIKTYTNTGETVLDNCMGSGTTGVACVNTNRNFIGIERDAKYFDIATTRINSTPTLFNELFEGI